MSATIDFHGPYEFKVHYHAAGTVEYHPEAYTSLDITNGKGVELHMYFHTMEEADAFARAGLANLDVLAHGSEGGAS